MSFCLQECLPVHHLPMIAVCVRASVRACERACVRACMRACVRACVQRIRSHDNNYLELLHNTISKIPKSILLDNAPDRTPPRLPPRSTIASNISVLIDNQW